MTDQQHRDRALRVRCGSCGEDILRGDLTDVVAHVLLYHPEKEAAIRAMLDEMSGKVKTEKGRRELAEKYPAFAQFIGRR